MTDKSVKLRYVHEPLDPRNRYELRLLEVTADASDPIRCSIHAFSDPVSTGYTCLSYEWGPEESEDSMRIILVNGAQLRVRRNLWNFLDVVRTKSRPSTSNQGMKLWIDAICIDQRNLKEKSEQVQRMGKIYRDAQQVVSWLGLAGIHGELSARGQLLKSQIEWVRQIPEQDFESVRLSEDRIIEEVMSFVHQASEADVSFLVFAACRGYWDRAWILQEVSLSENNVFWCGDAEMPRQRLMQLYGRASLLYAAQQAPKDDPLTHASSRDNQRMQVLLGVTSVSAPRNLYAVLPDHLQTKCSNPADRIYSLLALIQEGSNITVDHERSRVSLFFRALWACQDSFCICLGRDLIQALDVAEDLQAVAATNTNSQLGSDHADLSTKTFVELANVSWHPALDVFPAMITEEDQERRRTRAHEIIQHGLSVQCRCSVVSTLLSGPDSQYRTVLCCKHTFGMTSSHMLFEVQNGTYHMVTFLPGTATGQSKSKNISGVSLEPTEYGTFTLRFTLWGFVTVMQEFASEDKRAVCFHTRNHNGKVCFEHQTP